MRVAIIDLGTNSVRFDVHAISERGKTRLLHREKLMIRLGQGVFLSGRVDPHATERALQAFTHFRRVAGSLRCRKIVAFGTSALREAHDSAALVEAVKAKTGIEIRVISGKEEAKLIALGVLENDSIPPRPLALVDIGGGSTEISICRGRRVKAGDSFPLGTARLQQVFLKRSPPKPDAVRQLRGYIQKMLREKMDAERWPRVGLVVASSGTARAIARILDEKKGFSREDLSSLVSEMTAMNTSQLLDVPGMEAKRVDMVLAGALLLEEILYAVGAKRVQLSEFSLRDGIIEEERRLARFHKSSLIELHLDEFIERAVAFGGDETHLRHVASLAEDLFRKLRPLHRLDHRWKVYLLATMIFRNVGELVGFVGKEKHAHYIVKHLDIPAMDAWEHGFIAQLCLHQTGGKVSAKDLQEIGKDKNRRAAFPKILALVRLLCAIDVGSDNSLRLDGVQIGRRDVRLRFGGRAAVGVEQLLFDRKRQLFETVFGRQLLLERSKRR